MSTAQLILIMLTFFATMGVLFIPTSFYLISLIRKKVLRDEETIKNQDEQITQLALQHLPYIKKEIMYPFETAFFKTLNELGEYHVFPQLNMDKVIRVPEDNANKWIYINQMERKSFDFCLVDKKTFETKLVIELDGDPHVIDSKTKASDSFKREALKKVGINLLHVVRNDGGYNVEVLKKNIVQALAMNSTN